MKNLYWVGIKESEIRSCGGLFEGSITFNGTGESGNISYSKQRGEILNYNQDSNQLDSFIRNTLLSLISKNPKIKFMFYSPSYAYYMGNEIVKHTICLNDSYLLNLLRDKMKVRLWFSNDIPVLKTVPLSGAEFTLSYCQQFFPGYTSFILQGCTGSGGNDTFVITEHSYKEVSQQINKQELYLLSPYLKQSYSINIHVIIADTLFLTPASIQIVEKEENRIIYHGADFMEYQNVPDKIQKKILYYTNKITLRIQNLGYRGIVGIDYIVSDESVFFLEINPRFQSSSALINLAYKNAGKPTLQEMTLDTFQKNCVSLHRYNVNIPYSCYITDYYPYYDYYELYCKNAEKTQEIIEILYDGFEKDISCEKKASIFSMVFQTNISTINANGSLNIHENIKAYSKIVPQIRNLQEFLILKTKLFVQGVQFTKKAISYLNIKGMRKGTYSSVDLYLTPQYIINVPISLKLCTMSPFYVDYDGKNLWLTYAKQKIKKIHLDYDENYKQINTKRNIKYGDVSFLATDRLRIHHSFGCYFKEKLCGCNFCDVPSRKADYRMEDVYEVIDWHIKNSDFRHILIGGGSEDREVESGRILDLIHYIRKKTDKSIYLMSLPPYHLDVIEDYYKAGLSEIAFNIEIFDREIAENFMPGKGKIPLLAYQNALLKAVELFGKKGNVKSLLIYGLEPDYCFLEGVEWLTSHGIQPVISVFRPLTDTELSERIPSRSIELEKIYNQVKKICQKYSLLPGPDCIYCQNNTLSIPNDTFWCFDN